MLFYLLLKMGGHSPILCKWSMFYKPRTAMKRLKGKVWDPSTGLLQLQNLFSWPSICEDKCLFALKPKGKTLNVWRNKCRCVQTAIFFFDLVDLCMCWVLQPQTYLATVSIVVCKVWSGGEDSKLGRKLNIYTLDWCSCPCYKECGYFSGDNVKTGCAQ